MISDPTRIYDPAEVLDAFPDPTTAGHEITIDFGKGTIIDASGVPIAAPGDLPPLPGIDEPASAKALQTAERVRQWLARMQVDYDKGKNRKNPLQFVLKRCVFNVDHLDVMAIMVVPATGALWAGCFHDSCGGNSQRWNEVAEKIGGWGQVDPEGFRYGSQTEIAERLLRDLAVGSTEGVIFTNGAFHRYSPLSGVWGAVDSASASRIVQSYNGRKIGEGAKRLLIDQRHVTGAIALAADRAARPDFFDTRVDGIAFVNGFVRADSEGVRIEPCSPAHRAQVALGVTFDASSECPRFLQFLDEIFSPDEDAALKRMLLQEFTGAALLGFATRYESALFLTGSGSNGKSTYIKILKALFPPGTISAVRPQDFDNEYYRARLAGDSTRGIPPSRLNMVAETPEDEIVGSHSFKEVVSGDMIGARYPSGRPFEFAPIAAQWFVAQELPPTRDASHGFWRKVTVIAFNRLFTEAEQDKYLYDYLVANELSGIAAWAIEGGRRLCAQGHFSQVASSEDIKQAWRREGDVVLRFIDECCTDPPDGELPKLQSETDIDALYQDYRAWCRYTGHVKYMLTKHAFAKRLNRHGYTARPSNGKRYYRLVVQNPPPTLTFDFN